MEFRFELLPEESDKGCTIDELAFAVSEVRRALGIIRKANALEIAGLGKIELIRFDGKTLTLVPEA